MRTLKKALGYICLGVSGTLIAKAYQDQKAMNDTIARWDKKFEQDPLEQCRRDLQVMHEAAHTPWPPINGHEH